MKSNFFLIGRGELWVRSLTIQNLQPATGQKVDGWWHHWRREKKCSFWQEMLLCNFWNWDHAGQTPCSLGESHAHMEDLHARWEDLLANLIIFSMQPQSLMPIMLLVFFHMHFNHIATNCHQSSYLETLKSRSHNKWDSPHNFIVPVWTVLVVLMRKSTREVELRARVWVIRPRAAWHTMLFKV